MNETGESVMVKEQKVAQSIGEIIIGLEDPRNLSEQAFNQSPELLYHGSKEPIQFSSDYDYETNLGPNSSTVGAGLYTTPVKEDARLFSLAWGANEGEEVVTPFLPYQARMFDFRDRSNPIVNAPVPRQFFDDYRAFVTDYIQQTYLDDPSNSNRIYQLFRRYRSRLNELFFSEECVDLREMLSLTGNSANSEFGAVLFNRFMKKNGFDGVIYLEGGDHKQHKNPASYVFFNLSNVGTFESWHKKNDMQ